MAGASRVIISGCMFQRHSFSTLHQIMRVLRPFQKKAIESLCSDSPESPHLLCIAPTGSGKSLIYESVISSMKWKTLLITPLIALARQQHQKLTQLEIPSFLTCGQPSLPSSSPPSEYGAWIMSPESLQYDSKREALLRWKPDFLVVDECHCLWEWGESFRPAFQQIPLLLKSLPSIKRSLWLTATLPHRAREQLKLHLLPSVHEIGEFDLPPRLHLSLKQVGFENRAQALLNWTNEEDSPGMIFVCTRAATEKLARLIRATGRPVVTYHGGMSSEERRNTEALIRNENSEIIISTSAFGMGMDYSHINRLLLWQVPTSMLSLVQIIGRVGRGNNSQGRALAFWDRDDFKMLEWSIHNLDKRRSDIEELHTFYHSMQCRRVTLKKYFNPKDQASSCHQCDWCDESSSNFR